MCVNPHTSCILTQKEILPKKQKEKGVAIILGSGVQSSGLVTQGSALKASILQADGFG